MARHILSLALLSSATVSLAQYTKLTSQRFHYPDQIPYKVDTIAVDRGPQFGYTQCNSTTEGQSSNCQLAILNHADDFCLWGPPNPNSTIGDEEAETVAFCSKGGHGSRIMPANTITGLQILKAPDYILFSGTLNQANLNIQADDGGGEMDPHGADERGNPLGGLVYTNAFPSNNGNNNSYQQVIEWHNFMGSNVFCFKICDPSKATSQPYCNNIFDRTGCTFVAPAAYAEGTFETCDSENQDPVGVYTENGQVLTYKQPPEGVEITSLPAVKVPASSNCVQYKSADLFAAGASISGAAPVASGTTTGLTSTGTPSKGANSRTSSVNSSAKPGQTTGAAARGVQVPAFGAVAGVGTGPFLAIGASILAGLAAVLAGL